MESNAFKALMIGVYITVFVVAATLTIYLFNLTFEFSDKAFEYGKLTTDESIIDTSVAPKNNVITGAELLTYYYNYVSDDKYGETTPKKYVFENIGDIDIGQTYTLIYKQETTGKPTVIEVKTVKEEDESSTIPPITTEKRPTDPVITTYPDTSAKIQPNKYVEFKAESQVTNSVLTNSIKCYHWKIRYSTQDGRGSFSITTDGIIGNLTRELVGDKILFKDGTYIIEITAEDMLGSRSNTIYKTIQIGYNNPQITRIYEVNNKVYNYGVVNPEGASGAYLRFNADSKSLNDGGFVTKFEWYVNGTLISTSGANAKMERWFAPGNYTLSLKVYDSVKGTTQENFSFTVKDFSNPLIDNVYEINGLVYNGGSINPNGPSGAHLNFNTQARSLNAGGSIARYDYYVNGALVQSSSNSKMTRGYAPGSYTLRVVVYDSIKGSREQRFTFKVNNIPAPVITTNNAAINSSKIYQTNEDYTNLTLYANISSSYGITSYVFNIDGTNYNVNASGTMNFNFFQGSHTITAYGKTSSGVTSLVGTFTFTIRPNFSRQDFAYNGRMQTFTAPVSNWYTLEVWGAQGGNGFASWNGNKGIGGRGGYATGKVYLAKGSSIYLFVGGQGNQQNGGYNGGGNGIYLRASWGEYQNSGGGGGATDIRQNGTGLENRIIIAGGGGGSNIGADAMYSGFASTENYYLTPGEELAGSGRYSQIDNAGKPYATDDYYIGNIGTNGTLGKGGNGADNSRNLSSYGGQYWLSGTGGGGGGGGYYGGGGGSGGSIDKKFQGYRPGSSGGGGSSYINTSLTNRKMYAGKEFFLLPSGSYGIGNSGNGFARISF